MEINKKEELNKLNEELRIENAKGSEFIIKSSLITALAIILSFIGLNLLEPVMQQSFFNLVSISSGFGIIVLGSVF